MLNFLILCLFLSLLLYLLFGGADFGSGILELFHKKYRVDEQRKIISKAMGPVWEANHMWLIIAVVVLFSAFPSGYSEITTYLHIPILILLLGIILRGCSFTFRNYDAFQDASQKYYSIFFGLSSVLSAFFIGVLAASLSLGMPKQSQLNQMNYIQIYIKPWANGFAFVAGILVCFLFAMLAAAYLIGETEDKDFRKIFRHKFHICLIGVIVTSVSLVFVGDFFYDLNLWQNILHNKFCFSFILLTIALTPMSISSIKKENILKIRIFVGTQLSTLFICWCLLQYPFLFKPLTLYETAAAASSLQAISISIICGLVIIFPSFTYLIYIFKFKE